MSWDLCTSCNYLPELSLSFTLASIVPTSVNCFFQICNWLTLLNQLPLQAQQVAGGWRDYTGQGNSWIQQKVGLAGVAHGIRHVPQGTFLLNSVYLVFSPCPFSHGQVPFQPPPSSLSHLLYPPPRTLYPWGHLQPATSFHLLPGASPNPASFSAMLLIVNLVKRWARLPSSSYFSAPSSREICTG